MISNHCDSCLLLQPFIFLFPQTPPSPLHSQHAYGGCCDLHQVGLEQGEGSEEPCAQTAKLKENFREPSKLLKNPVSCGASKGSAQFP